MSTSCFARSSSAAPIAPAWALASPSADGALRRTMAGSMRATFLVGDVFLPSTCRGSRFPSSRWCSHETPRAKRVNCTAGGAFYPRQLSPLSFAYTGCSCQSERTSILNSAATRVAAGRPRHRGRKCAMAKSKRAPMLTPAGVLDWTGVDTARRIRTCDDDLWSGGSGHERHVCRDGRRAAIGLVARGKRGRGRLARSRPFFRRRLSRWPNAADGNGYGYSPEHDPGRREA